jgi:adenosylmethionine-8-amino-7-oxononanoate aminotransferase
LSTIGEICRLLRKIDRTGPYFIERMKTLLDLPIVGDVRGSHMMVCVECMADRKTKAAMLAEWDVGYRIIRQSMPRGLLVRPMSDLVILSPPLAISKTEIDQAVVILGATIRAVTDELIREGVWRDPNG